MRIPPTLAPSRPTPSQPTPLILELETTTPIMGAAAILQHLKGTLPQRVVDDIDVIRVPSIKGQLRFWWRALVAHQPRYLGPDGAGLLYKDECALWGGARDEHSGARSPVDLRVEITYKPTIQDGSFRPHEHSYALFPLRGQSKKNNGERVTTSHDGQRRPASVRFTLTVCAPTAHLPIVKQTLTAWLLFGGIGSRTRRGLGSLKLLKGGLDMPRDLSLAELRRVLGPDVFSSTDTPSPTQTPNLAHALLLTAASDDNPADAWLTAINWLQLFRQGEAEMPRDNPNAAREFSPSQKNHSPGRSNWPEPDMLRHLHTNKRSLLHSIRYNTNTISWPRAALGLPILGRFQKPPRSQESDGPEWELTWRRRGDKDPMTRLASPLILKPLSLDTTHNPIALWLGRKWPDGEVVAKIKGQNITKRSEAPFDAIPHDTSLFTPLNHGHNAPDGLRVRTIFERWLQHTHTFNATITSTPATRIK